MNDRPHVTLSCAMSLDGHIDDLSDQRLLLSNDADFDRVDAVRAEHDAILVGATTIRRDNPRLLIRSAERQQERSERGTSPHPVKVTMTTRGDLDPDSRFFTAGDTAKLVYAATAAVERVTKALGDVATVVNAGAPVELSSMLADLSRRGIESLMVEGGGHVHTQFLAAGLADEIHLVVAPFLVGQDQAPRFLYGAEFPQNLGNPMRLAEARAIGDVVLLRYQVNPQ